MTDQELDARCEIAKAFINDFVNRPRHLKMFGPQNSEEWLRSEGFYNDGAIVHNETWNRWRIALGMDPVPKEHRFFHQGKMLPLGVRTMNELQFAEYKKLLDRVQSHGAEHTI